MPLSSSRGQPDPGGLEFPPRSQGLAAFFFFSPSLNLFFVMGNIFFKNPTVYTRGENNLI